MPVTASLVAAGVGTAIKAGQAIGAGIRARKLRRAARKLGDAQYSATPQLLSYYDQALQETNNPQGLSQGEIGAAKQGIAGMTTGNIRNAQRLGGGNISSQINAALNNANVISATNLAGQDAQLRRQNRMAAFNRLGTGMSALQGINDRNVGLKLEKIRALGKAISDARMTANNALGDVADTAIGLGSMGIGQNGGLGGMSGKKGVTQMPFGDVTTLQSTGDVSYSRQPFIPRYQSTGTPFQGDYNRSIVTNDLAPEQPPVRTFNPFTMQNNVDETQPDSFLFQPSFQTQTRVFNPYR